MSKAKRKNRNNSVSNRPDNAIQPECAKTRELLGAYADGETSAPENARIAAHLEGCARCRQALEDIKSQKALLLSLREDAPAELMTRIHAQLLAEKRQKNRRYVQWGALAASFVIVVAVTAFSGLFGAGSGMVDGNMSALKAGAPEAYGDGDYLLSDGMLYMDSTAGEDITFTEETEAVQTTAAATAAVTTVTATENGEKSTTTATQPSYALTVTPAEDRADKLISVAASELSDGYESLLASEPCLYFEIADAETLESLTENNILASAVMKHGSAYVYAYSESLAEFVGENAVYSCSVGSAPYSYIVLACR